MKECLEEGTIQAYVDGELSSLMAEKVATHASACAACAAMIAEAENELTLLADAFEPEFTLPVPSEQLRERINAAVGELRAQAVVPAKSSHGNLKGWLASLVPSFNFAPRHALGFASLVAVVAFAAIFGIVALRRDETQPRSIAKVADVPQETRQTVAQAPVVNEVTPPAPTIKKVDNERLPVIKAAAVKPRSVNRVTKPTKSSVDSVATPAVAEAAPLPGEGSYLRTIASLTSIIETNGENAIKPSLRSDYERNLALVNQAIDATRRSARRNPKDPNAAEILYSSYQSKIDLLSTVAEQGQMVAVAR